MSVLIIGLMFSSFSSAVVSVLTYFSSAEQLQTFYILVSRQYWQLVLESSHSVNTYSNDRFTFKPTNHKNT